MPWPVTRLSSLCWCALLLWLLLAFTQTGVAQSLPQGVRQSQSFYGRYGVEVAAYPTDGLDNTGSSAGVFHLSRVPDGAQIERAWLVGNKYFQPGNLSATFNGVALGSVEPFSVEPSGSGALGAYTWDVTSLVTGNGEYPASNTGSPQLYGVTLIVVFSHLSLPLCKIQVNLGAEDLGAAGTPDFGTTTFEGAAAPGTLWLHFGGDDAFTGSGEEIQFNGTVVGGPIDAGLGRWGSLFEIDVPVEPGDNTVEVWTQHDRFAWDVAVLQWVEQGSDGPGIQRVRSFEGRYGVEVAVYPTNGLDGTGNSSGVFHLSRIPEGAQIERAWLVGNKYFQPGKLNATFNGVTLNSVGPFSVEVGPFAGLGAYVWDVTSLVTGNGDYAASNSGTPEIYGVTLVVVFSHSSLPLSKIQVNLGAEDLRPGGESDAGSTILDGISGLGTLWLHFGGDDAFTGSGEEIRFNGAVVAGPIDANLGPWGSLFEISVPIQDGDNTVEVRTPFDRFAWDVAVLQSFSNQRPVARDDSFEVVQGGVLSVSAPGALENDSDPDGDALVMREVTAPQHGTLGVSGDGASFVYTPDPSFYGVDAFSYKAYDGQLRSDSATVQIRVLKAPMAIVSVTPSTVAADGASHTLTVLGAGFEAGVSLYWNAPTNRLETIFVNSGEISVVVPPSYFVPISDLRTILLSVGAESGPESNQAALILYPAGAPIGGIQSAVLQSSGEATVTIAGGAASAPQMQVVLSSAVESPIAVVAATYDAPPAAGTSFGLGDDTQSAFMDLQITGVQEEETGASAAVTFIARLTGDEAQVALTYILQEPDTAPRVVEVLSSGGLPPVKIVEANPDGSFTVSFSVIFDSTSMPRIAQLSGTIFGLLNASPQLKQIKAPSAPVPVGAADSLQVEYAVVGEPGDASVKVFWGGGLESPTLASNAGKVTALVPALSPGVYKPVVKLTDSRGRTTERASDLLVVYDPAGGFVTGGGWIQSPAGAFVADPSLTGKANFGFVSKYQKGASVPTGQTQFEFQIGALEFHSTSYEWLVVSGARAQYKGAGTINGETGYGFLLTAVDGQVNGGDGTDRFRIKIWDATGSVVYDNFASGNAADFNAADPEKIAQLISSGSITVQGSKK